MLDSSPSRIAWVILALAMLAAIAVASCTSTPCLAEAAAIPDPVQRAAAYNACFI